MSADAPTVARDFFASAETAWNHGDGQAFGSVFDDDATFVDIRGVAHEGARAIAAGHQGIFDTIYKGSTVRYQQETARPLSDTIVLARGRGTLTVPGGPLAGVHEARNTVVLVQGEHSWRAVAFHNTVVSA